MNENDHDARVLELREWAARDLRDAALPPDASGMVSFPGVAGMAFGGPVAGLRA